MFEINSAFARIMESKQKHASYDDDSDVRVLKTNLKLSMQIAEMDGDLSGVFPGLGAVLAALQDDKDLPGLDITSKVALPICAVEICRAIDGERVFGWNAVEVVGRPKLSIEPGGFAEFSLGIRVTTTKADMERLVDFLDADVIVSVSPSDPLGAAVNDDPRQTSIGDFVGDSDG